MKYIGPPVKRIGELNEQGRLKVNLSFDNNKFWDLVFVTDDVTIISGRGNTQVEALFDYLNAHNEYKLLPPLIEKLKEDARDALPDVMSWEEIEDGIVESEKKLMEFQKKFNVTPI